MTTRPRPAPQAGQTWRHHTGVLLKVLSVRDGMVETESGRYRVTLSVENFNHWSYEATCVEKRG